LAFAESPQSIPDARKDKTSRINPVGGNGGKNVFVWDLIRRTSGIERNDCN
jgi:hypothetical protein